MKINRQEKKTIKRQVVGICERFFKRNYFKDNTINYNDRISGGKLLKVKLNEKEKNVTLTIEQRKGNELKICTIPNKNKEETAISAQNLKEIHNILQDDLVA